MYVYIYIYIYLTISHQRWYIEPKLSLKECIWNALTYRIEFSIQFLTKWKFLWSVYVLKIIFNHPNSHCAQETVSFLNNNFDKKLIYFLSPRDKNFIIFSGQSK